MAQAPPRAGSVKGVYTQNKNVLVSQAEAAGITVSRSNGVTPLRPDYLAALCLYHIGIDDPLRQELMPVVAQLVQYQKPQLQDFCEQLGLGKLSNPKAELVDAALKHIKERQGELPDALRLRFQTPAASTPEPPSVSGSPVTHAAPAADSPGSTGSVPSTAKQATSLSATSRPISDRDAMLMAEHGFYDAQSERSSTSARTSPQSTSMDAPGTGRNEEHSVRASSAAAGTSMSSPAKSSSRNAPGAASVAAYSVKDRTYTRSEATQAPQPPTSPPGRPISSRGNLADLDAFNSHRSVTGKKLDFSPPASKKAPSLGRQDGVSSWIPPAKAAATASQADRDARTTDRLSNQQPPIRIADFTFTPPRASRSSPPANNGADPRHRHLSPRGSPTYGRHTASDDALGVKGAETGVNMEVMEHVAAIFRLCPEYLPPQTGNSRDGLALGRITYGFTMLEYAREKASAALRRRQQAAVEDMERSRAAAMAEHERRQGMIFAEFHRRLEAASALHEQDTEDAMAIFGRHLQPHAAAG